MRTHDCSIWPKSRPYLNSRPLTPHSGIASWFKTEIKSQWFQFYTTMVIEFVFDHRFSAIFVIQILPYFMGVCQLICQQHTIRPTKLSHGVTLSKLTYPLLSYIATWDHTYLILLGPSHVRWRNSLFVAYCEHVSQISSLSSHSWLYFVNRWVHCSHLESSVTSGGEKDCPKVWFDLVEDRLAFSLILAS